MRPWARFHAGGVYQAPATVPIPNTIQVQATSLADTTATASRHGDDYQSRAGGERGTADHDSRG